MLGVEGEADRDQGESDGHEHRRAVDRVVLLAEVRPADPARPEEREDPADSVAVALEPRRPAVGGEEAGEDEKAARQVEAERQSALEAGAEDRAYDS
jgi:hypothetical protein